MVDSCGYREGRDPVSLSPTLTKEGPAAIAYYPRASTGGAKCMSAKIAFSEDLQTWKPCVQSKGLVTTSLTSAHYPSVVTVDDDELWAIFQLTSDDQPAMNGIYAWPVTLGAATKP